VRGLRYLVAAAACVLLSPASAWGWTSPLDLSSHSEFANEPAVGMNARGDTAVAWSTQVDPYHSTLYATVRPGGGGWGSTQTLSIPADLQNAYPSAAVDASGDTLVVWGATSSLGETRAAFAPAGQPFQSPVQVGATYDGSEGDAYPFVAFDDAGNAIAFWLDANNRVYDAERPAGGSFAAAQQLPYASSDSAASYPDYAVAGNGEAVAVWDGTDSNGDAGYAVIRNANGTFDAPQTLVSGVQFGPIHVAMDDAGDAVAVWAEQINEQGYMKAAFRSAGSSTFGAPVTVAQVPYAGNSEADVAMDAAGDGTIVWPGESSSPYVNDGPTAVVHHAGTTGFGAPQGLGGVGAEEPPEVAYDAAGNAYVVWRYYDSNTESDIEGRAVAETAPAGGSFSGQPDTISELGYNVWPPALAAGPAGQATAAWPIGTFNGNASQFWIQEADAASGTSTTQGGNPSPAAPATSSAPPPAQANVGSTGAASVNPAMAASACAAGGAPGKRIGTHGLTRVAELTACLLRTERGQLGLRYAPNRGLSSMLAGALARFTGLSYLAHGQQDAATHAEALAATNMLHATCRANHSRVEWTFADVRPRATPLQLARLLASELRSQGAVARASGAVFGVAARRGLLFEHGDRSGASFGVTAVTCG
jgi:hypothetical protein